MPPSALTILGGGLAGSEAAWQAAERGCTVTLYEMRPTLGTGAHATADLAELVCSNSLGSDLPDRPSGLLKQELRRMGSLLIRLADETAVPAGRALAVDREQFSRRVTEAISTHPRITLVREEIVSIPQGPCILASGPLTSPALADSIAQLSGEEHLYFFDAISPIVERDSIDFSIAFTASRYDTDKPGSDDAGDYINCPMNRSEYTAFVEALVAAERIPHHSFETQIDQGVKAGIHTHFEGCLPVEIIARRGPEAMAFGPLRPVGLTDPRTGRRPAAVVQLRQDNIAGTLYNLVGFQTNLKFPEQQRVFRMIPGLEQAEFVRYGQMHRNTFIASPKLLLPTLQLRSRENLFVAGQLTGIEGYAGNIATGLLAGWNASRQLEGQSLVELPPSTMLGALCHYVTHADMKDFQPMKSNFGLFPPVARKGKTGKRDRARQHSEAARQALETYLATLS